MTNLYPAQWASSIAVKAKASKQTKLLVIIAFLVFVIVLLCLGIGALLITANANRGSSAYNGTSNSTSFNPSGSIIGNVPSVPKPGTPEDVYYKEAVMMFRANMNTSADICNDFYGYVCGQNKPKNTNVQITTLIVGLLKDSNKYANTAKYPKVLQKTVIFFKQCLLYSQNPAKYLRQGRYLSDIIDRLSNFTGWSFAMMNGNSGRPVNMTPVELGKALAYLSMQGVDTLLSPRVDVNWDRTNVTVAYMLYVDQSKLFIPLAYYAEKTANYTLQGYQEYILGLCKLYSSMIKQTLKNTTLQNDVNDLYKLELSLARKFITNDNEERSNYTRMYNYRSLQQLQSQFPFVDWPSYLTVISDSTGIPYETIAKRLVINEPGKLKALNDEILSYNTTQSKILINYLFFCLLAANEDYLPQSTRSSYARDIRRQASPTTAPDNITVLEMRCADKTMAALPFPIARMFLDYVYGAADFREIIRDDVRQLSANIITAFQGMLIGVNWLDDSTRTAALDKAKRLTLNIGYPDFIFNNTALDIAYENLAFDSKDTYLDLMEKLHWFNLRKQYGQLTTLQVDRMAFDVPPTIENARYTATLNSIVIPDGIMHQPNYHYFWPAAMNYGKLGMFIGHELNHAFDNVGVQWDSGGQLQQWMTNASMGSFKASASCLINEYNGFCPLDNRTYRPNCVDGVQTERENLADNGGLHAAYRAFRAHIDVNGPDMALPDPLLGRMSPDQLFFLSFGLSWCDTKPTAGSEYIQILTDPHAPFRLRVLGTLRNFPAFRAAFNCPAGSLYAPLKHCSVWV